ncbi:MAG: hypothetical protein KAI62_08775, partial [Actinomycetia bacterium]|nr:hypothetical protein [Actinomycetes bacterium]
MNGEINSIWQNILTDIKSNINLPTYKTWFESINPQSLKKNTLTVSVASSFAKEWLESRYLSLLNNSTKKIAGDSCKIKIITQLPDPAEEGLLFDSRPVETDEKMVTDNRSAEDVIFNTKYTFDTFVVG